MNELVKVIKESGVEKSTAKTLEESFSQFFNQAEQWKEKALALVVTDESQGKEMLEARKGRLALKEIRVNADKKRKELKEDSIRYGRAVQGLYNVIEYLVVPLEKHLEKQEKFKEFREAERKEKVRQERQLEIEPLQEFLPYNLDLANMSDEDYLKLLNGAKIQLQAKVDAEKKADQERQEQARLNALENERRIELAPYAQFITESKDLRLMPEKDYQSLLQSLQKAKIDYEKEQAEIKAENERLKKEREAAEKKAEIERQKADAERKRVEAENQKKLDAERKEKERIENDLKKEREAKEAELKAKADAEAKAKAAPDKAKLLELAKAIDSIDLPELKSEQAIIILNQSKELLLKVSNFIREKTNKL